MSLKQAPLQTSLPPAEPVELAKLVSYHDGSVVSRTLVKKNGGTVTVFAFDAGQSLSEHTAPFDAIVQVLDGEVELSSVARRCRRRQGKTVLLPAGNLSRRQCHQQVQDAAHHGARGCWDLIRGSGIRKSGARHSGPERLLRERLSVEGDVVWESGECGLRLCGGSRRDAARAQVLENEAVEYVPHKGLRRWECMGSFAQPRSGHLHPRDPGKRRASPSCASRCLRQRSKHRRDQHRGPARRSTRPYATIRPRVTSTSTS